MLKPILLVYLFVHVALSAMYTFPCAFLPESSPTGEATFNTYDIVTGETLGTAVLPIPDLPVFNEISHDMNLNQKRIVHLWTFETADPVLMFFDYDNSGDIVNSGLCNVSSSMFNETGMTSTAVAYVGDDLYIGYNEPASPGWLVRVDVDVGFNCEYTRLDNPIGYEIAGNGGGRLVGLETQQMVYFLDRNSISSLIAVDLSTGIGSPHALTRAPFNDLWAMYTIETEDSTQLLLDRGNFKLYEIDVVNFTQTEILTLAFNAMNRDGSSYFFNEATHEVIGPEKIVLGKGIEFNSTITCPSAYSGFSNRPFDYFIGEQFPEPITTQSEEPNTNGTDIDLDTYDDSEMTDDEFNDDDDNGNNNDDDDTPSRTGNAELLKLTSSFLLFLL